MPDVVVISADMQLKEEIHQLFNRFLPAKSLQLASDYSQISLSAAEKADLLIIDYEALPDGPDEADSVGTNILSAHGNLLLLSTFPEQVNKELLLRNKNRTALRLPLEDAVFVAQVHTLLELSKLRQQTTSIREHAPANERQSARHLENESHALAERIKELNCLYQCSRLAGKSDISLSQLAKGFVEIVPPSWQYPESACARISIGDEHYLSANFSTSEWVQQATIQAGDKVVGSIEVYYRNPHPMSDEGPFMREERSLINTLARIIGHFIYRQNTVQELNSSRERLIKAQQLARMGDFTWHIESGKVSWSKAMYQLLGYSGDEAINFDGVNKNIHHPDDAKWVNQWLKECILSNNSNFEPRTYRLIKKDGSSMHVQTNITINRSHGKAIELFGTVQDITHLKQLEWQQQASDELQRSIVDSSPIPIFSVDMEGTVLSWNKAAEKNFGWTAEEAIGHYLPIIPPDRKDEYDQNRRKVVETGGYNGLELFRQTKNGKLLEVSLNTAAIRNRKGKITGIMAIMEVITQRKAAERALFASEERFRTTLQSIGDGLWDWNLKTNAIYFSEHWKSMLGYAPDEIRNHFSEWEERVHPDDLPMLLNSIQKYLKEFPTYEPSEIPLFHIEHRIRCKNKQYKWIIARGRVIESDKKQKPLRFIGTHTDITARKLAELQLKTTQFGIDHAQVGIYQIEEDGSIIYANQYAAQSLGYTCDELLQLSLFDITPAFNKQTFRDHRVQTRKLGSKTIVTEHRKKDGTIFPVEVTINYFHFNDRTMSFSFVKDITEQQKIQQQLAHLNELMRYIIEHANSAVAVFDLNMHYVFVSQRFIDEHQIADAEIIGKHHYKVFPNILPKWKEIHQQALAGEVVRKNRDMIQKKDGSIIWTRWECRPWYTASGAIGGIVLYTEEITGRVKAEHAIRESEQKYRSMAENISEAIWTADLHFNTTYISPAIEKIIGISPAEYIQLKLEERFPPVSVKIIKEMISKELKLDKEHESDKNRSLRFQLEHYHNRGGTLWISMNLAFIRDESGSILGFHGITHDITAQKKAELALRKLKGQLEEQVAEKTKALNERIIELQRFHDATIDREFRIKALRDEIKQLKGGTT